MRRAVLTVVAVLVVVPVAGIAGVWAWMQFDEPTPADELLEPGAAIDLAAYDGSEPPVDDAPSVLVLGTVHLAREDHGYAPGELEEVVGALAGFEPDLVAVEHLPPDWPVGEGRDTRPGLELDVFAARWGMTFDEAEELVGLAAEDPAAAGDPCEVGRAHLLRRDLANAAAVWAVHGCEEPHTDEELAAWWDGMSEHELVRIAAPVAHAAGVPQLVSVDEQGDDARWFLHEEALTLEALTSPGQLWQMLPEVNPRSRELQAHADANDDRLVDLLHHLNSPEWIGVQYWAYEQSMPGIEVRDAGERQAANYWLRNERMFERLHAAVRAQGADRVLVVVGAGHKYFLDELARDHGYRWVDPRRWLPPRD